MLAVNRLDGAAPDSDGRPAALGALGSLGLHAAVIGAAFLAAMLLHSYSSKGGSEPTDAIEVALEAPIPVPTPPQPQAQPTTPPPTPRAPISTAPSDLSAAPPEKPQPQPVTTSVPQTAASAPAAAQSASTAVISPRERDAYVSALMAWLNRFKQYPAEARRERVNGVVIVRFAIDSEGRVLSSSIARSSGHPSLDDAAIDMFTRASPLPQPPKSFMRGVQTTLTLPIEFSLITR